MKKIRIINYTVWGFLALIFSFCNELSAQIAISDGVTITENFTIGTATSAPLPVLPVWRVDSIGTVRTVGLYSNAVTSTWRRGGNNMSTTASNGVYNYGAGDATTATDRAVGFLSSTTSTKSGNLYVKLNNVDVANLTGFTINYNVEKYRYGANNFGYSIQLYYSTDGINWTSAGTDFLTSFVPDADNAGFVNAPGFTVPVSAQLNVLVNSGSDFYLAWNYSVSGIGNTTASAQGLGIDDVSITATSVICETPTSQACNINFTNMSAYTMDVNWTNGNGMRRLVVMNTVNTFTNPINGTEYTASSIYGGSGEQVIYKGSGNTVSISGLSANSQYYFKVFEINCYSSSSMYNTIDTVANPVAQISANYCTTPTSQATNMTFSALSANSIKVNFTNGDADFRIVVVRQGFSVTSTPTNGVTYNANSYFGLGNTIAPNEFVVYKGSGSSTSVYGLQPNTVYYFAVFEYCTSSGDGSEVYLTPALSGSQSTTSSTPSSCFEIESILVDACARAWNFPHIPSIDYEEGPNEMVRFVVGNNSVNTSDMTVDWPNNAWQGICQNVTTAEIVQRLNNTIPIESCGKLLEPPGGVIPPKSNVLLITSSDTLLNDTSYFDILGNTFETLTDTLYAIFQCSNPNNRDGHFGNYDDSSQVRTLRISFSSPAGCSDTVRYNKSLLVNQNGGYGGSSDLKDGARVDYAWDGTATYGNQGCRAPFVPLEIFTIFYSSGSGTGNNICQYQDIQLAASTSNANFIEVFWTGGSGIFSSPNMINTTYTPDASETGTFVSLTLNLVSECNDTVSSTINIDIYAEPIPIITATPDVNICEGKSLTLTATDNAVSGATYNWSTGATTSVILFMPTTGTYTVTATSNGCTASENIDIVVNPNPTVFLGNDTSICQGQTLTLDAGNGFTYNWLPGNISTQTINVNSANNYSVTITDSNGCTDVDTLTLTINNNPIPLITGTLQYCVGSNTTLDAGNYDSYIWSNSELTQTIDVTAGIYSVTVIDNNNCVGVSSNVTITENALPTPSITGNQSYCAGYNTTLDAGSYSNYLWSNSATTQTINATAGNYSVTVTDANGCKEIAYATVTENSLPTPTISGLLSYCAGSNTTLDAGTYSAYLWSNSETSENVVVTSGVYVVTVTDSNGCQASTSATVIENALPTPTITGNLSYCAGSNTTLNAGSYSSYLWSDNSMNQTVTVNDGTYSVTVTDSNGCEANTSAIVTENSLPTPIISGSLSYCTGFSTNLSTTLSYSSYLWSNNGNTSPITVTAGTYSVTVTDANGCVGSSNSVTVSESTSLNPVITGALNYCQGSTTTLDAGVFSSYLWSNNATSQTINVTAGTYSVSVTDSNGCSGLSSTVSVTENALPSPTINGNLSYCAGSNTTLDAGSYTSYLWSNSSTTNLITVIAGTYTVTVTDSNGCKANTSVTVVENPLPNPSISGSLSYCASSTTTLDVGSYSSYIWTTTETSQSITVTAGTYSVTVIDGNNCSASVSVTVTENSLPTPSITGNLSYCADLSTTLDAGLYSSYLWSNSAISQTINATAGTYSVSVTDSNGCSAVSSIVTITENPLPTPTITGNLSYCAGSNTTLFTGLFDSYLWSTAETSQSIVVTAGNYTVTVTATNGCSATATAIVVENALPSPSIIGSLTYCVGYNTTLSTGSYSSYLWSTNENTQNITVTYGDYSVTVTDSNGCTGISSSVTVIESTSLSPVVTGVTSYCAGSSTTLDVGVYANYNWSTGATTQTTTATIADNPISVTVSDGNGCSGVSAGINLIENALPTPTITGNLSFCAGSTTTLSVSSFDSYLWSTLETSQSIVVTAGNYIVNVTDANGCSDTTSATVIENSLPVPTITGSLTYCEGNYATLSTQTYSSYLWSNGSTSQSISATIADNPFINVSVTDSNGCVGVSNSVSVTISLDFSPVITGTLSYCADSSTTIDAGSYSTYLWSNNAITQTINATAGTYSVSVTDSDGCSGVSSVVTVIENALPTPDITGNLSYCVDSFTVLNAGLYSSYIWSTSEITQTINVSTSGKIFVTVSDANNCKNIDSVLVSEYNTFTNNSVSTSTSCNGSGDGKISITVSGTEKPYSFEWNTNPVKTDSIIVGLIAGNYIVTISDKNNCSKTDTIIVTTSENACLEIPTCFTPNNDNINDKWEIKHSELYPKISVEIYNRWGELIFKSDGYKEAWDGTYNGKEISVSSFIYIINLNDGSEVLTGTVSVIK